MKCVMCGSRQFKWKMETNFRWTSAVRASPPGTKGGFLIRGRDPDFPTFGIRPFEEVVFTEMLPEIFQIVPSRSEIEKGIFVCQTCLDSKIRTSGESYLRQLGDQYYDRKKKKYYLRMIDGLSTLGVKPAFSWLCDLARQQKGDEEDIYRPTISYIVSSSYADLLNSRVITPNGISADDKNTAEECAESGVKSNESKIDTDYNLCVEIYDIMRLIFELGSYNPPEEIRSILDQWIIEAKEYLKRGESSKWGSKTTNHNVYKKEAAKYVTKNAITLNR